MGTITTGTGLYSGLDIQGIVEKLVEVESTPVKLLEARVKSKTTIQTTLNTLSTDLVAAKLSMIALGPAQAFAQRTATSSSTAISATAGPKATLGTFSFTPKQLVSTHQVLSTGYSNSSSKVGAGTVTVSAGGFVDTKTKLDTLNGGTGVRLGTIRLTDESGSTGTVDLSGSVTIQDVVDKINAGSGYNITASVKDGSLVLTDATAGDQAGAVTVQDVSGGYAATDLGINGTAGGSGQVLTGNDVLKLGSNLKLGFLNDGNGVRNANGAADFQISDGASSFNVSTFNTSTVDDVISAINTAASSAGVGVTAAISSDGKGIALNRSSGSALTVTALNSSLSAHDLGLDSISGDASATVNGKNVIGELNTVLLDSLQGGYRGSGDTAPTPGTITISGATNPIDLSGARTLQDVVDAINDPSLNDSGVTAAVNSARNGITLTKAGGGSFSVADSTGNLASFLNIAGASSGGVIKSGDLNRKFISEGTKLAAINGGKGVPAGKFSVTDGNGNSATIDLTQSTDDSIGRVIQEINGVGLAISARVNDTGDGILIEKTGGASSISVTDLNGGKTAANLRLTGSADGSGNINGRFKYSVDVTATDTLDQVVSKLNAAGAPIGASVINDGSGSTPFRLSLTSTQSGAAGELLIDTGTTSLNLNTVSLAKDAVIVYGGGQGTTPIQVTSNTNTFSGLVPGLAVTVSDVSNSPVSVTVAGDKKGLIEDVQKFVDAFNTVADFISENSIYDSAKNLGGPLFNESSSSTTQRRLREFVTGVFTGTSSSIRTLGELGLSLDSDGKLNFDSAKFESVYDSKGADVEALFITKTTGVAAKFSALIDDLTGDTGVVTSALDVLQTNIDTQNKTIDNITSRLEGKKKTLLNQFYAMENAVASLQAQQSSLLQLANIKF